MPPFTAADIRAVHDELRPYVLQTPVWRWHNRDIIDRLGEDTEVWLKLELWQRGGSFKLRGALNVMLHADRAQLEQNGVTAVSAGNHAIAVSLAAKLLGISAKVVMFKTANPGRIAICRELGATVELPDDVHQAFARVDEIQREEGRLFVHPFENPRTVEGTATVGLEFCDQVPNMDALIVPIGGGGLIAGMAAITKLMQPNCTVYGVEPVGANSMYLSFQSGQPEKLDHVSTIADSLGAPFALPYTFEVAREHVDEIVLIDDDQMRAAQALLFSSLKLAAEPAGAAATAALLGPLRDRLLGRRVGVIVCGSNTDIDTFATQVKAAQAG